MKVPQKDEVFSALVRKLEADLEKIRLAAQDTSAGVTHEDARAEGDKDMRSTEQSYVARGQAKRATEIADDLQRLSVFELPASEKGMAISAGMLVVAVLDDDSKRVVFIMPCGGGTTLEVGGVEVGGVEVAVITPSSPVGAALVGREEGDVVEIVLRGATREWQIERVA